MNINTINVIVNNKPMNIAVYATPNRQIPDYTKEKNKRHLNKKPPTKWFGRFNKD